MWELQAQAAGGGGALLLLGGACGEFGEGQET